MALKLNIFLRACSNSVPKLMLVSSKAQSIPISAGLDVGLFKLKENRNNGNNGLHIDLYARSRNFSIPGCIEWLIAFCKDWNQNQAINWNIENIIEVSLNTLPTFGCSFKTPPYLTRRQSLWTAADSKVEENESPQHSDSILDQQASAQTRLVQILNVQNGQCDAAGSPCWSTLDRS